MISCKLEKSFYSINICSSKPIHLKKFIKIIEKYSKKINLVNVPAHPADVYKTHGSNKKLITLIKKMKFTNIEKAIKNSVNSYKKYKIFNQNN